MQAERSDARYAGGFGFMTHTFPRDCVAPLVIRSSVLLAFRAIDQGNPWQLLFREEILCWWKLFRMVEAPGRNVDLLRARIAFISQGGAAKPAKRPPRSRVSAIPLWSALLEAKVHSIYRNPGSGLRADRSPTIGAVAIGSVDGSLCGLEPDGATVASASD